jgi:hypothetical protein
MTSVLAEVQRLDKTEKFTAEPGQDNLVQLHDGRVLVKKRLSGQDFFDFQDAVANVDPKSGAKMKLSEGLKSIALKMFVWQDGSPLTIDQLLDNNEDSIGFEGMSILSESIMELFDKGRSEKKSLRPAS